MPLPTAWSSLQNVLNTLEHNLMGQLQTLQPPYRAVHGRYFQGIATSDFFPVNGENVVPNIHGKPDYQAEDWAAFGVVFPATIQCACSVFVSEGPDGFDWSLRMGVELDGVPWGKIQAGVGVYFDSTDWVALEPAVTGMGLATDGPMTVRTMEDCVCPP